MSVSRRHAVRWVGYAWPVEAQTQYRRFSRFSRGVPFDAVVPAASTAASNVCRRCEATTMEPKCELIQLLYSDQRRELIQPPLRTLPVPTLRCRNLGAQTRVSLRVPTAPISRKMCPRLVGDRREVCAASSRRSFSCSQSGKHGDRTCVVSCAVPGPAVMPQSARRWYGLPPENPMPVRYEPEFKSALSTMQRLKRAEDKKKQEAIAQTSSSSSSWHWHSTWWESDYEYSPQKMV